MLQQLRSVLVQFPPTLNFCSAPSYLPPLGQRAPSANGPRTSPPVQREGETWRGSHHGHPWDTFTPFQKATRPLISAAAALGSG